MGRFINADGFTSTGQGLLGNNMFAYCGNNPVMRVDPAGGFWWILPIIIVPLILTGCTGESDNRNCYSHILKLDEDPTTGAPFTKKPQPGSFSGSPLTQEDLLPISGNDEAVKIMIEEKVSADASVLGYSFSPANNAQHIPQSGNWVVALAYSTDYLDYHWWLREDDGTWSHKPGRDPVIAWDNSGKAISDPRECDRGIYNRFLGYYEIGPN